jgi:hypothetical protein
MTTSKAYLRYHNETDHRDVFIQISDILEVGIPIDQYTGDDLEQVDDFLYRSSGETFVKL